MSNIFNPTDGDDFTVAEGEIITVSSLVTEDMGKWVHCYVDDDHDDPFQNPNPMTRTHNAPVPINKPPGTYDETPVFLYVTTSQDAPTSPPPPPADDIAIDIVVTALIDPNTLYRPMADRTNPAPPAPLPPPGSGPIVFTVGGKYPANTAYIVCVVYEVRVTGPRIFLGGVCAYPLADGTWWAGGLWVPNLPDRAYVARVVYYDVTDNSRGKRTVVLVAPPA